MRSRVIPLAVLPLLAAAGPAFGQCPSYETGVATGSITYVALTEISGMAASRANSGVLWVHNDSGDGPRIFSVNFSGALLGEYVLGGAAANDWEDMAIGPGPLPGVDYLYVGDIGDNANNRSQIQVYRVAEPFVSAVQPPVAQTLAGVEIIRLTYPDGPRDAETLMVDFNGDLYVVSKRVTARGRVYRAAYPQSTTTPIVLEFVGELPWGGVSGSAGATGGDIAPDGSAVIIRRYTSLTPAATLWLRPRGTPLAAVFATAGCNAALRSEGQGEAVTFGPCGWTYYTVSEGTGQPIYGYVPRPGFDQPRGDSNCDGIIDFDDIECFVAAIISPASWESCGHGPGCRHVCTNDVNADGAVNFGDIDAFVAALIGG